jgi:hypothetical protein
MNTAPAAYCAMLALFVATGRSPAVEAQTNSPRVERAPLSEPRIRFWEAQRGSGLWRTNYSSSSKALDDEHGFFGATVQLKAYPEVNERMDGKLEVRLTNSNLGQGAATRGQLLEGYVTMHFAKADLRLGKQIVPWGRADGINPTDNLTPRDYAVLLPFEDDQRLGTTAAKLDLFVSPEHTLTVFATPFFEPARVPMPVVSGGVMERKPAHTLSNTHAGIRLNKVGATVDWSVSYLRGFSLLPGVQIVGDSTTSRSLELNYDRIAVFGADFARNFGRFGLRGEVAYVDTPDGAGITASIANPSLQWIVGVDRTFLTNLNVNLQAFQRRVRSYRDVQSLGDSMQRETAMLNALITGQLEAVTSGVSFRVSNQWLHDALEAEIFAVQHLKRNDALVRVLVTYAFSDRWKGTVGAELYRGAADTQYGALEPNRGAFAELRHGF